MQVEATLQNTQQMSAVHPRSRQGMHCKHTDKGQFYYESASREISCSIVCMLRFVAARLDYTFTYSNVHDMCI